jgi:SAM-dependent methyltransferase
VAGFDDFHTAGRMATVRIAELLAPGADETVLDAGSGLGGPARYLAQVFGCRVIGIDLTPDFVAVANLLNQRLDMDDRVEFRVGDITLTRDEQRALLERAGFRIDVWEDPTEAMVEVLRAMLAGSPAGAEPPVLHPSLFIDDLPTKGERYFANMESGRTALVLAVCTAT